MWHWPCRSVTVLTWEETLNYADRDPVLRPLLDRLLTGADRERIEPVLRELGALAGGELDELAAVADANPPRLRQYSPSGERIDEIEYHPAYQRLAQCAFERFGLAAMSHRAGVLGWPGRVPHVVKYALSYLFVQAEFGLACPVSMTDSAARVLRLFDPERYATEIDALSSTDPATRATGAMFMTERQGGTDVGLTATEATDHGSHWTLRGQKWFASNVAAEVILTLARVPGQGAGTRGLGMFLVPRILPDGSRNGVRIDRLKDKLGSRSMASGEVTLQDAHAWPVGELTSGFRQMAEMVNVSRLSNAMRATALMRRAVRESVEHTRQRVVLGKALFDQPLMRATLLPMIVDTEAALGLVLESALRLDAADAGDPPAGRLVRVLTPLAKYTLCKQARTVTGEAMEIRGGNGYIEDWVNPRLLRDAHLGSIWEGSSNVIALDVLRCMRRDAAHQLLADTYSARLDALTAAATPTDTRCASPDGSAEPDAGRTAEIDRPTEIDRAAETRRAEVLRAAGVLRARWTEVRAEAERLLAADELTQQSGIGRFANTLAYCVMATLLLEQAAASPGHRALLVAHTYLRRLLGEPTPPRAALEHLDALADGTDVPLDAAASALPKDALPAHSAPAEGELTNA